MNSQYDVQCESCKNLQGKIRLSNAPRIFETSYWIIEHIHPTSIKGWLVLVLKRHCKALHELSEDEYSELSKLLKSVCEALHRVLDTEKEYVMQLAEMEGFNHVHFHVIARGKDWPKELKGPRVFSGQGKNVENPLPTEVTTPIALQIQSYLQKHFLSND